MRITVLLCEGDDQAKDLPYVIWAMSDAWRAQGHTTEVVRGVPKPGTALGDVVFLHLDLTVVPEKVLAALQGHPCVVNRFVADISKSRYSRNRVRSRRDKWDGPVIIKTDRNYGGQPEKRLQPRSRLLRLKDRLAQRGLLPLALADVLYTENYPIYTSPRDVPFGAFHNPALFIERFRPERSGGLYCMRNFTFFGDRWINELYKAPCPVVSRGKAVSREEVEPPQEILELRQKLGFDYGKFDYVLDDGEVVVFDVNKTPSVSCPPQLLKEHGRRLAPGLDDVLQSTASQNHPASEPTR